MSSSPTTRKARVCTREACEPCRKGRSKCDGQTPCARCSARGLQCEYQARIHRSKRSLRDEIDALKERQREQDALLEALQDPLRRDVALRMLQERSRAGSATNNNSNSEQRQQPAETQVKQEEGQPSSSVGGWASFEDVRATSGSPLHNFTSPPTTRPMVSTTPQMSWTAPMRPDAGVAPGVDSSPFPLSSATPGFPGQLAQFVHGGNDSEPPPMQQQMPMEYSEDTALPLPYRVQNNDWAKGTPNNQMASQHWMAPSPAMGANMPLQQDGAGSYHHVGGVYHPAWEKPQDATFNGAPIHGPPHEMAWTPAPAFSPVTNPNTSSFPPNLTTRPVSPVNHRTNSDSTTASSGTTRSSATSMTSAPPSTATMKPPPVPFFEQIDESGRRQSMPENFTASTTPSEGGDARERHRVASARSWSKQKTAIADLQETVYRVEAQHNALRHEYTEVQHQVLEVHNALLKHVGCNDPAISQWLKRERKDVAGTILEVPGPSQATMDDFTADSTMMGS